MSDSNVLSAACGDPRLILCHGCTAAGTCRLGLKSVKLDEDGIAQFELYCPADHEGGPGVAHGGWTAGALDELLGQVVTLNGRTAVVGTLNTVFLRPIPVDYPLFGRSWIERRDARKWHVAGEITLGASGTVVARAQGIFVLRDAASHYAEFGRWLKEQ
jgi:acyl-coenzyme A thioesterase PaaI-like protein